MKTNLNNHKAGFTMIEYIVALVVASIIASMLYTFFGSSLTQSTLPFARLKQASKLYQVMENIVADYNRLNQINLRYKWRSDTLYSVNQIVNPSDSIANDTSKIDNNGRYYKCTTAGRSKNAGNVPTWLVTDALTEPVTDDNGVVWRQAGCVWKANTIYPSSCNGIVVPAISNGHFYRGSGTTSGPTDPKTLTGGWPTRSGGFVSDNTVTWTEVGTILDSSDTSLHDNIIYILTNNPGKYGTGYNVDWNVVWAETKFIKFIGTPPTLTEVEADLMNNDEKNILRVTIKNKNSAEKLTQLFTIR